MDSLVIRRHTYEVAIGKVEEPNGLLGGIAVRVGTRGNLLEQEHHVLDAHVVERRLVERRLKVHDRTTEHVLGVGDDELARLGLALDVVDRDRQGLEL